METVELQISPKKFNGSSIAMRVLVFMCIFLMLEVTPSSFAASKVKADRILQAKNYIFAACMINSYKGEAIAVEAEIWAGGLVENGNLSAANYVALADLAKTAPLPGVAQQGAVMRLQNCIEFSNSPKVLEKAKVVLSR